MNEIFDSHGKRVEIQLAEDFLADLRGIAEGNRKTLDAKGVKMIDVMGSVGAGKTSLVEQLVCQLKDKYRIVVLNGDLTTTIDQERILQHGVEAIQVNTGKECHLDAPLIASLLATLELDNLDLILVENVGNLICPAEFPLGSNQRLIVVSVTEGPYVVMKHPHVFAEMDVAVINKIDLAPLVGLDVGKLVQDLKTVNPHLEVYTVSSSNGTGIPELVEGLMK